MVYITSFIKQLLPTDMENIDVKSAVRKAFFFLFADLFVIFTIYFALRHRTVTILLMKFTAFCILFYFFSLVQDGVINKADTSIQVFIYIVVGLALTVILVSEQKQIKVVLYIFYFVHSYLLLAFLHLSNIIHQLN